MVARNEPLVPCSHCEPALCKTIPAFAHDISANILFPVPARCAIPWLPPQPPSTPLPLPAFKGTLEAALSRGAANFSLLLGTTMGREQGLSQACGCCE